MPRLRKPRAVRPGDTIAIAAPGFAIDEARVRRGERVLRDAGFEVVRRKDMTASAGYLAGDDARRARELRQWIADPKVAAILCARGGWGSHRILSRLDAQAVREARKPLLGFSDVTTLLLWQRRAAGLIGFHAPMFDRDEGPLPEEVAPLVALLSGAEAPPLEGHEGRGRRAEGRLVGGSLTLLAASLGTPWEVDTRGAILLFEEVGEKPYAIDRLLHQLEAAGKLDAAVGFGVGHLTGCQDPKRATPTAEDVVAELLAKRGKPLVTGLPFGHGSPNLPWPVGGRARIDGRRAELRLLESPVTTRNER